MSTATVARPLAVAKARVEPVADTNTAWARLVFSYLAWAAAWLLFGTLVGEYLGIKFVIPDIDHISWLSFGRLRPVHTNTVFWGWSSLAMVGMALYVVPKTSRRKLFSFKLAYVSLALINLSVFVGNLLLMGGINNGGQEYREYIWPVQAVFAVGVILTAYNLIRTIADRDVEEIYVLAFWTQMVFYSMIGAHSPPFSTTNGRVGATRRRSCGPQTSLDCANNDRHLAVLGMCHVWVGTLFFVAGVPQIGDRSSFDAERANYAKLATAFIRDRGSSSPTAGLKTKDRIASFCARA